MPLNVYGADNVTHKRRSKGNYQSKTCPRATAGFLPSSGINDPYTIDTQFFPQTVPLSLARNFGTKEGNVKLESTGLKILESGDYLVSFTALINNTNADQVFVPLFLVRDNAFDPTNQNYVGGSTTIPGQFITEIQGTGILYDVKKDTHLSILATNVAPSLPQPVSLSIYAWSITVLKICCCND